jgi:hypothetical protein
MRLSERTRYLLLSSSMRAIECVREYSTTTRLKRCVCDDASKLTILNLSDK